MYIEFYCNAMCSSRNYPYLPTEGILYRTLHSSLWKFQLSFIHFFKFIVLVLQKSPTNRKFQSLLWGEHGYFLELHNGGKKLTGKRDLLFSYKFTLFFFLHSFLSWSKFCFSLLIVLLFITSFPSLFVFTTNYLLQSNTTYDLFFVSFQQSYLKFLSIFYVLFTSHVKLSIVHNMVICTQFFMCLIFFYMT